MRKFTGANFWSDHSYWPSKWNRMHFKILLVFMQNARQKIVLAPSVFSHFSSRPSHWSRPSLRQQCSCCSIVLTAHIGSVLTGQALRRWQLFESGCGLPTNACCKIWVGEDACFSVRRYQLHGHALFCCDGCQTHQHAHGWTTQLQVCRHIYRTVGVLYINCRGDQVVLQCLLTPQK
jgi:hypothetical protein